MDTTLVVLVALGMLVGLVGTVLPLIPGLPIVWGAALIYGLANGFGPTGVVAFAAITLLTVIGMIVSFVLPHRRVSATGAPRSTVIAGLVGAIVGFFLIPVVGMIIGGVGMMMLKEYGRTSDVSVAWASTKAMLIGFGLGIAVELGAGLTSAGVWVLWVLFG